MCILSNDCIKSMLIVLSLGPIKYLFLDNKTGIPESGVTFPFLHQSEPFLSIKLQLKPQLLMKPSFILV